MGRDLVSIRVGWLSTVLVWITNAFGPGILPFFVAARRGVPGSGHSGTGGGGVSVA